VARLNRRPAAAKLPVSTTVKNTWSWSRLGVPMPGISNPLNVMSGILRVFWMDLNTQLFPAGPGPVSFAKETSIPKQLELEGNR
jgi:hypothetical protein